MPLVSTSIPNLLNGVSQQPSSLRQVTQGETQTNALSSVIDGLIKRPPTEHIKKLLTSFSSTKVASHIIDRGVGNRHLILITATVSSSTVYAFDLEGNSVSVVGGSNPYLFCSNPALDLEFLTVADYTFVLNKTKVAAMTADISPGTLITSSKYQGFDDLPVETSTHHVGDGNTQRFPVGFNFHDTNDLTVKVNGATQTLNSGYYLEDDSKTIRFSSVPANYASIVFSLDPPVGDMIEVIGDEGNAFDSFYVESVSKTAYEETVKPGIQYKLDPATLPHSIVPNLSINPTQFTLQANTWEDRVAGDLDSAPDPSFVGKTISNMFFYKNRFGMLSDENVIFSGAGDFFRFFPKTVTTILDDGPIDVSASHTQVSLLKHAIPFNESLTIFAESTQFRIENAGNLTPKTISIIPTTDFENDTNVAPVGAGNYLYFTAKKGDYSSVLEYYIQSDTVITDATEITAHVPKYIPKNLTKLATSSNQNTLVGLSTEDPSKLYVYKWFSDGKQKLQSSWSTWQFHATGDQAFDSTILDVEVVESNLYIIVKRGTDVFFEKLDLEYLNDTGLDFCARMDGKTSLTGSYSSVTGLTTWQLPYDYPTSIPIDIIKSGEWPERKGADIPISRPSNSTVTAVGNYSAYPVLAGVPYTMEYEFSTQHIREKQGAQSVQSGRLQLRTMRVNFDNSGYFRVEVTPFARSTYEYEYKGITLNQLGNTIGDVVLNEGTFRFPLQSRNDRVSIKVISDSYLPCAFQNAEWEGFYTIRSQRI